MSREDAKLTAEREISEVRGWRSKPSPVDYWNAIYWTKAFQDMPQSMTNAGMDAIEGFTLCLDEGALAMNGPLRILRAPEGCSG